MTNNRLIAVLGMHRSGTSALTRSLQVMGVNLGDNLIPPMPGVNAKGFWEDSDFVKLNIDILTEIGSDWHYISPIREHEIEILQDRGYLSRSMELLRQKIAHAKGIFCFKDPRVTKLLPFWKRVFSNSNLQVSYIVAIRNPLSVSKSLEKRDGFHTTKSYLLWLTHVLTILSEINDEQNVVVVDYDRSMQSPDRELHRIADRLNLVIEEKAFQDYKNNFLDDALRNTTHTLEELSSDDTCPPLVCEIYKLLLDVASDTVKLNDSVTRSAITRWLNEFDRSKPQMVLIDKLTVEISTAYKTIATSGERVLILERDVNEKNATIEKDIPELRDTLAKYKAEVATNNETILQLHAAAADQSRLLVEIQNSRSWKITSPLRSFGRIIRKIRDSILLVLTSANQHGGLWRTFKKFWRILRVEGIAGIKWRLRSTVQNGANADVSARKNRTYEDWVQLYDTLTDESRVKIRTCIQAMSYLPKLSVIMPVYNPPVAFLEKAIATVRNQLYPNWELCIADDCSTDPEVIRVLKEQAAQESRIRLVLRTSNGHISKASNSALELASGDYVAMFDHDDELPEHALYMVAEELNRHPEAKFLYSDQDKISENGKRFDPYFKPDFNLDLLRSQNFVDHLAVFKTSMVRELGGWRSDFDGSQDYDMVLRVVEQLDSSHIRHIPHVLYHWRALPGSLAIDPNAKNYAAIRSREALREHLQRVNIRAEVTSDHPQLSIHRVIYPIEIEPLVSIIIPTKDGLDILRTCIDGILNNTDYSNLEIIIVDNQSKDPETLSYLSELSSDPKFKILKHDKPFNYSEINNYAVRKSNGTILAFLNNDIEVISKNWLTEMVSHALRTEIGAVGARLFYPDDTVQHAGVLLGYKGRAGHMYRYAPRHWLGYWARAVLIQNLTAVTAACLVVRKDVFNTVGGFDEKNFTVTFNDVDLCLRIHEAGYRNLYTPYAELYHHESKTRGTHAFQSEEDYFSTKWQNIILNDPAYNPNLTLEREDFSLAFPPRVTHPWVKGSIFADTDSMPLVSVIIRTHGERQNFLKEAITSIFGQMYRPIQIIVAEDGGDNALSTLETVSAPPGIEIDYISLPKKGRCYAGNRGMEKVRGEFFGFLDDDDLFLPNHLDLLVRQLLLKDDIVGAYAASYEVKTEVQSLHPLSYIETSKRIEARVEFSLHALWNYNYIPIQALLLRRELIDKFGGLSEELDCLEDWDLWLRYTSERDFIFVDAVTSLYRMPANESVLENRRRQHLSYLPVLRRRQAELLHNSEGTDGYQRLRQASADMQEAGVHT